MKLLIDAHCFDYKTSEGVNTYLQGLYTELIKIADDIDFYFMAVDVPKIKRIFGERSNVFYVPLKSKNKVYRLLFEIPIIIKVNGIDIAHYQYTSPLIKNCKSIVTLHDILFLDYPHFFSSKYKLSKSFLFWLSAKRANLLLTVSEYSKKQISKHYKISSNDIFVTPDAVSEDFFSIDENQAKNYTREKGIEKYLLYVSRIEPRKNQTMLLKAYVELKLWEKGYDLVFIGRKTLPVPDFDSCYCELSEDIRKRVHIYNQVDFNHLLFWYKAADLFVYPSFAEGFGIPPIEAGAAGIPCICSNQTAMKDFSFFGNLVFDPNSLRELENRISLFLEDSGKVKKEEIQNVIRAKYNWKTIAANYLIALKKVK